MLGFSTFSEQVRRAKPVRLICLLEPVFFNFVSYAGRLAMGRHTLDKSRGRWPLSRGIKCKLVRLTGRMHTEWRKKNAKKWRENELFDPFGNSRGTHHNQLCFNGLTAMNRPTSGNTVNLIPRLRAAFSCCANGCRDVYGLLRKIGESENDYASATRVWG